MAVAATIAPSTLNRLTRALEKEKPSYLVVSSLERDAQTLLGTEDAPLGYVILGMLAAMENRKQDFDQYFDQITASDRLVMGDIFRLSGLNRMSCFDEANEYLKQMLVKSANIDDPELLKLLAYHSMLYGYIDDAGDVFERLKRLGCLEPNYEDELELIYLLLKETGASQNGLVSAILAAKKLLSAKGLRIPTYSFGYSIEFDIFIELKMICFADDLDLLAEADEALSHLLVEMEESTDKNLVNFNISCRSYNTSYGTGC